MKILNTTKDCLLLFVLILFCSCSKDLSRDQSISLINVFPEFVQLGNSPFANSNGLLSGYEQGFWDQYGNISNYGTKFFANGLINGRIYLKQPVKPKVISITGIKDAASSNGGRQKGIKEVQFQWEYTDVEGVAKRFIVRGGTGVAYAQLYDDGWRIERIATRQNDQIFLLSPSELADIDKDRQKEMERRVAEANRIAEESRKFQELQEKRALLIEQSKTPTKTIGSFTDVNYDDGKPRSRKTIITDVNLDMMDQADQGRLVWFGDIKDEPSMSGYRQTAFGWNGYRVVIKDPIMVIFKSESECNLFYQTLVKAIADWKAKYQELQN
jgi:hypothetical protein